MMREDYITFEIAKLLKEKGFNPQPDSKNGLFCMYDKNGNLHYGMYDSNWYWRITHQMVLQWFREVHNIFIEISTSIDLNGDYHYSYFVLDKECKYLRQGYTSFDRKYEDAVEAAIKYILEKLI